MIPPAWRGVKQAGPDYAFTEMEWDHLISALHPGTKASIRVEGGWGPSATDGLRFPKVLAILQLTGCVCAVTNEDVSYDYCNSQVAYER